MTDLFYTRWKMSNPVLISESFERASYSLQHAMERFGNSSQFTSDVDRFVGAVEMFRISVDKLNTTLGMQAENDQRKAVGSSMAYTEDAFARV